MGAEEATWSLRVEQSLLAGDGPALRSLYAEGQVHFGDDVARRWAQVLSAFDASAVTG